MIGLKQSAGVSLKSNLLKDALKSSSNETVGIPKLNTAQIIQNNQNAFNRFDRGGSNKGVEGSEQNAQSTPLPKLDANSDGRIDRFEVSAALGDPRVRGTELEQIAFRLLKQQASVNKSNRDGNLGINLNVPPPQGILGFHGVA